MMNPCWPSFNPTLDIFQFPQYSISKNYSTLNISEYFTPPLPKTPGSAMQKFKKNSTHKTVITQAQHDCKELSINRKK